MYYDRGDHMIGQYNVIVDFYPLLKALLPRDSDRVEGQVVAQERDLLAARADEPGDPRAMRVQFGFDGGDAEDAAPHLPVDGGDERIAGAHRQRSGGRVVEIDEALLERERIARKGRVRCYCDGVDSSAMPRLVLIFMVVFVSVAIAVSGT